MEIATRHNTHWIGHVEKLASRIGRAHFCPIHTTLYSQPLFCCVHSSIVQIWNFFNSRSQFRLKIEQERERREHSVLLIRICLPKIVPMNRRHCSFSVNRHNWLWDIKTQLKFRGKTTHDRESKKVRKAKTMAKSSSFPNRDNWYINWKVTKKHKRPKKSMTLIERIAVYIWASERSEKPS